MPSVCGFDRGTWESRLGPVTVSKEPVRHHHEVLFSREPFRPGCVSATDELAVLEVWHICLEVFIDHSARVRVVVAMKHEHRASIFEKAAG